MVEHAVLVSAQCSETWSVRNVLDTLMYTHRYTGHIYIYTDADTHRCHE